MEVAMLWCEAGQVMGLTSWKPSILLTAALGITLSAPPAVLAHHEAIFGPQSALVMSAPSYVSIQTYMRRTGPPDARGRETTGLLSAGVAPFRRFPISFTAILPVSRITEGGSSTTFSGREDMILGVRYRFDLPALQDRFDREGNFAMVMGAAELPSGNVDHKAFDGPMDYMVAALGSVEKGPLSGIVYGFGRMHGKTGEAKTGNNLFLGGGLAWTPFDNPSTERLLSFQAGFSHELYFQDAISGATVSDTGGWGTLVHPTVVWGPGGRVLLFGTTSFPVAQSYRDPADEDRWRFGVGVIWLLAE
jgi:hypothetical protein